MARDLRIVGGDAAGIAGPWPPDVPPWRPDPDVPWYPHRPQPAPPTEPSRRPSLPEWWEPTPVAGDIEAQLLDRRIIMLSGFLDRAAATRTVAALMLLDARSPEKIEIRVNAPDGELDAALAIAETIELARAPVSALASGTVGGPAVVAYAAAQHRLAYSHCQFLLREPHLHLEGRADEIARQAEQYRAQLDTCIARLAEATGQSAETVAADLRRGRFMSAAEACAYGLVHELFARSTAGS